MFECNQCESKFTQKSKLRRHIHSIHEGVKYACNQCEQQFTLQHNLKTHIQSIHEGIKYACNQCEFQATLQNHLKIHIQSKHEGIKYACNIWNLFSNFRCINHFCKSDGHLQIGSGPWQILFVGQICQRSGFRPWGTDFRHSRSEIRPMGSEIRPLIQAKMSCF